MYLALGRIEDAIFEFERIIALGVSPELSRPAEEELRGLVLPEEEAAQVSAAEPGTNLAFRKTVRASSALSGFPARMAVDGRRDPWNSGGFAPQWIVIDLGAHYVIAEVRLQVIQDPGGQTSHHLLARGLATDNEYVLLHTFQGVTTEGNRLRYVLPEPLEGVRYIKIESESSPSWIGWYEIEVLAGAP